MVLEEQEKIFYLRIGNNINKIRIKKKLTVLILAELVEMEKSNLTRILKGRTNITAKNIYRLSLALKVPAKEFFK